MAAFARSKYLQPAAHGPRFCSGEKPHQRYPGKLIAELG